MPFVSLNSRLLLNHYSNEEISFDGFKIQPRVRKHKLCCVTNTFQLSLVMIFEGSSFNSLSSIQLQ